MIFSASCPVFESVSVFYGYNNMSVVFDMLFDYCKEVFIGILSSYVALTVFEYTYKKGIIIISIKIRFYLLEIAHFDADIVLMLMSCGVDHTSLS